MANCESTYKTSLFRVTDEAAYDAMFDKLYGEDIEDFTRVINDETWHGFGGFGGIDYDAENDGSIDDFIKELQPILHEDDKFEFITVGNEKLRYVFADITIATRNEKSYASQCIDSKLDATISSNFKKMADQSLNTKFIKINENFDDKDGKTWSIVKITVGDDNTLPENIENIIKEDKKSFDSVDTNYDFEHPENNNPADNNYYGGAQNRRLVAECRKNGYTTKSFIEYVSRKHNWILEVVPVDISAEITLE